MEIKLMVGQRISEWPSKHIAKSVIFENNRLTMGEQKNAILNFYNLLLTEFRVLTPHAMCHTVTPHRNFSELLVKW